MVNDECAPHSIWQVFHLFLISFYNALLKCPQFLFFPPIDLALFSLFTFFLLSSDIARSDWRFQRSAKCNKSFCNAPDLSYIFSFFWFMALDLNHERLQCSVVWKNEQSWASRPIFSDFFLYHLLARQHASSQILWERKSFLCSLYATESARLKFLFLLECLLV